MPADDIEHLGKYQFGRYMFTKDRTEAEPIPHQDEGEYPAATRYVMARDPNATEREALGDLNAPAFDVGTMDINHHPAVDPLPVNRVVGNASGMAAHTAEQRRRMANTTHSESFKELHLPHDEVDFLTVEKASRLMVPTMLGLAQNEARATTGQDVRASSSLSPHSQRLVGRLKDAGMVPESHTFTPNQLTFTTPWPMSVPGGLEGHLSSLRPGRGGTEKPIPVEEVEAAKKTGRDIVRRSRPK